MKSLSSQSRVKRVVITVGFAVAVTVITQSSCTFSESTNVNRNMNRSLPLLVGSIQDIHDSKILFNPPREMEQGKTERIEARISYQDVGDAIQKELKGRGDPQVETIQVGQKMTVTLHADGNNFDIKKYGSDEQLVAGRPYAQWEWDVTPLEFGDLTLHLKAVINLAGAGGLEGAYDIPVIDRVIKVKVNPPYIAAKAARNREMWNIVFGSGIGVAILGGLLAWLKRRRDQKEKEKEQKEKEQKEQKERDWETP